jgi:hypothetical protein
MFGSSRSTGRLVLVDLLTSLFCESDSVLDITAVCGPSGLREDTQLSQSSPFVIQSLSGVPEALSR